MYESVWISVGSNLNDPLVNVARAVERLRFLWPKEFICSSVYRSAPVECPEGSPDFLNAAVRFEVGSDLCPTDLLALLQTMELDFGRIPKRVINESRSLDLDIISYGARILSGPSLTLPHPRAHLRKFVLLPMCEIDPSYCLPGFPYPVSRLVELLVDPQPISILSIPSPKPDI